MKFCDKCGAQLEESMKYCDKCGAEVLYDLDGSESTADSFADLPSDDYQEPIAPQPVKNTGVRRGGAGDIKSQLRDIAEKYLPAALINPKSRLTEYIGHGCIVALALVYLICMYLFIPDICWPIGQAVVIGGSAAGSAWILIYFMLSLIPVIPAVMPFINKSFKKYTMLSAFFFFAITVFSLICWGLSAPHNIDEAMVYYPIQSAYNTQAWFSLMDCLSEAWYLKFILSALMFTCYGIDFLFDDNN